MLSDQAKFHGYFTNGGYLMTFKDMIKARDAAIATEKKAEAERSETHAAANAAITRTAVAHDQAIENTKSAHEAIKALLVERGEHYLVDDFAALTVFKLSDLYPGYIAVQPIPGSSPMATEAV